jgi:uncharacterized membrane-anchored protein YjiN (DUF445 family)
MEELIELRQYIRKAALEVFEGQYSDQALRDKINPVQIQAQALELVRSDIGSDS